MCHESSEDSGRPNLTQEIKEIAFHPEALRTEELLRTLELLEAYVNFSYLKDSILGHVGRNLHYLGESQIEH